MAQASEEELNKASQQIFDAIFAGQQPGADPAQPPQQTEGDTNKNVEETELERMKRLLAEKDAQIAAMQEKLTTDEANKNDDNTAGGDEESKSPPKTDVTLSLRGIPEYDQYPFTIESQKFYFMASIKAPYFRSDKRAPIDLIAVVDESGSMSGDRIKLVKETVQFIIKNLESSDRFGIVGYSNGSRVVLPLTKMDQMGKKSAETLATQLRASGGTALCEGLVMGVNMMRERTTSNDVASVLILTDGQANQGPTSAAQINAAVLSGKVSESSGGYYPSRPQPRKMHKRKRKMPNKPKQQLQGPPPVPQPQQQQQQQQCVPPPPVPNKPNDEDEKQTEGAMKKFDDEVDDLPCTINTFGFGTGHNETLLESIAENGRGMYAFIESTDQIADTFAECLGGLVSIIGQNLKIGVEALNDVEINKCLSQGYTLNVVRPRKKHEISITNLQSEENRDLIFELKLPKLGAAKANDPIVQLSVKYKNVVKDKDEILSNVCTINRIEGTQIGERNIELDVQYNRVLAAEAMDKADDLANQGKLDDARKELARAQEQIRKSKSKDNKFSAALVNDMETVADNMRSRQAYRAKGSKMCKMNKKAHRMQRSVQSSAYASHGQYQNRSKCAMKKKFQK
eukprot:127289_1